MSTYADEVFETPSEAALKLDESELTGSALDKNELERSHLMLWVHHFFTVLFIHMYEPLTCCREKIPVLLYYHAVTKTLSSETFFYILLFLFVNPGPWSEDGGRQKMALWFNLRCV